MIRAMLLVIAGMLVGPMILPLAKGNAQAVVVILCMAATLGVGLILIARLVTWLLGRAMRNAPVYDDAP